MDAVSLAGVSGGTTWSAASSPCCCEARVVLPVCSSGPPSYPVAWSSCWCRLCLAACPSWRLLEEFPLLRGLRRAIRTWKSGHCLRPCIFQSFGVWVLPLEHVFVTRAWFNSGYMFYEWLLANFTYFLRVVHSDRGVPPFRRMEKCAQLMFRVAVSLRAVRTLNLDIISTSSSCDGVG